MPAAPPSVVISYVPADEASLHALERQLAPLRDAKKIAPWSAREVPPGEDAAAAILEHLGAADVVLVLLSADYLAADAGASEMAAALRMRHAEGATIVPVLVRPCLVDETPLGRLGPLPQNGEPISTWANQDLAWMGVAKAVRDLVADRGAGKTRALPPPLPRVPHFVGRDALADEVAGALVAATVEPVLLLGGPGIGKTTLSIAVVRRAEIARQFGARRVFARLDGATTGDAVKATVASAAGIPPGPGAPAALAAWLAEGPALVVLDNLETPHAADPDGTQAALEVLTEAPDVAVLASVRGTLRPAGVGWKAIELTPLKAPHDVDLFCELAREHAGERTAVAKLVAPLGGVPLAIALLAYAAQGNPLANLRLERRARGPAALDRGGSDKHASWAVCVDLSFQSPRMTAEARRLAAVLAMLPEGAAIEDVPELLDGPAVGSAAARVLAQVGVAYFENGRLRMLPPMREQVRAAHAPAPADDARTTEHFRSLAETLGPKAGAEGGREAIERLGPEWGNVVDVLESGLAGAAPGVWIDAAYALRDFVRISGLGSGAPLERARTAAARIADVTREADCSKSLGDIALARSDHDAARARFDEALALFRKVGNVLGEASCIWSLGTIALRRSDHDAARARFDEALALFRKVGNVLGEANCIRSLGDIALNRSDHDAALARFEEALPLYRKVGDVLGEANCIMSLGDIALRRSDHDAARARFEEALPLFRKVGSVLGEANCIWALGDIALRRSEHDAARARYEEALPLFRKVGDVRGEANCIKSLGDIALERSDHDAARARYEEALPLYRKVGDVLGEANCIKSLGNIALDRSDHDTARARYEEALPLFRKVGSVLGEANCIRSLGDIALGRSDHDTARARFEEALGLYARIPEPYSMGGTERRLARLATEDAGRRAHVEAAGRLWTSIRRPDLVAELDKEFPS